MSVRPLLIAVVLAVLSATLLVLHVRKVEVEASGGRPVQVLMLRRRVEAGEVLTADALGVRAIPQAWVEARAIRETDREKVIGIKLGTSVKAQQSLLWTDLVASTDDRRTLSATVQPGMRAVGIRAGADDRHFALMRPGDRVDVVASLPAGGQTGVGGSSERVSVLLAQNLLVLAVGLDMGGDLVGARGQPDRNETVLTVSATVQQLQQLSLASERGKLTVGLRAKGETTNLDGVGELSSRSLVSAPAAKAAPAAPTAKGPLALTPAGNGGAL